MNKLDISSWKEKGKELIRVINEAVAGTQHPDEQPYPSLLLVTAKQLKALTKTSSMVEMFAQEKMFVTDGKIVLEVEVI